MNKFIDHARPMKSNDEEGTKHDTGQLVLGHLVAHALMATVLYLVLLWIANLTHSTPLPFLVCWVIAEIPAAYNAFGRLQQEDF